MALAEAAYCGIDVGTTGVRAVVVSPDGTMLGSGSAALTSARHQGRHEQQPEQWWTALAEATSAAVAAARDADAAAEIVSVALDATSGTLLVEDHAGRARGAALMYDDLRAADLCEEVDEAGRDLWRSLGYVIQPTWALPKLVWLLRRGGLDAGDRVVHQADHLAGRLVGAPVATDTSHALKTGADVRSATWPTQVFDQLGVPASVLPELVLPGTELGRVSPAASSATGLPVGSVVRAGMTDGCAAQIASGALQPGAWSSALGTTLVVKGCTSELVLDPTGGVYCHRHPDGGWLPGGASNSGAGVFADLLDGHDLQELTREVEAGGDPTGARYPLVGRGERFPFTTFDPPLDRSRTSGSAELFGALCLGLAFVERLTYDVLAGLGADVSGAVAFTGGATRNDWLNQLRTDVLSRPVSMPAAADAAVGMAVMAAAAPGHLAKTAAAMVRVERHLEPEPARWSRLEPLYHRFVGELVEDGWLDVERARVATDQPRAAR